MGLVVFDTDGDRRSLNIAAKGQKWLSGNLDDQYLQVYKFYQGKRSKRPRPVNIDEVEFEDEHDDGDDEGELAYADYSIGDANYLGVSLSCIKRTKALDEYLSYDQTRSRDTTALRKSLYTALATLPVGAFHRVDSVLSHFAFTGRNPLELGLESDNVRVSLQGRPIPPLAELREDACRTALHSLFALRLIPLGCVRAALDEGGQLCVARLPRLDAYFGRTVAAGEVAGAPGDGSRVIVQPDFSIVVIGLNLARVAEVVPFCTRDSQGTAGQGSLILKLTRASVIKAVAGGLAPAQIMDRLRRNASNEIPPNVLREVEEWAGSVRKVGSSTASLLHCPDRETADRIVAVLKGRCERLNDTVVAVSAKLDATERAKLRDLGIFVGTTRDF
jgi:hypothetical protein